MGGKAQAEKIMKHEDEDESRETFGKKNYVETFSIKFVRSSLSGRGA